MLEANIISCGNIDELSKKILEYGMKPILFKCINGKNVDPKIISEYIHPFFKYFMPKSAIGCAISHIMLWEKLLASSDEKMLILEDDVIFAQKPEEFKYFLGKSLENVPSDFDLLYLGCFFCSPKKNKFSKLYHPISYNKKYEVVNEFINKPKIIFATHAYIISRNGADKLLRYLKQKIATHIDFSIQQISNKGNIIAYVTNPILIYQTSNDNAISTNTSSKHPAIIMNAIPKTYLDDKLSLKYFLTLSMFSIGPLNISIISLFFVFLGILFSFRKINLRNITLFYVILNLPDIFMFKSSAEFAKIFTQNYLLLILPSVISNYLNSR